MNREQCLKQLRESFTFQMSLGSKELFHSNFLQWLSVIDWKGFLMVLHELSGVQEFWWEKKGVKCNVGVNGIEEGNPLPFHPDNENVEVRRECNNYDLSVYILTGYTNPRKGGEPQKKWCPVFILENKVKSMPYQYQLDSYTNKAFKEWKVGKKKKELETLWTAKPVSFVLLTLFDEVAIKESQIVDSVIKVIWEKRNYSDLSTILENEFLTNKKEEDLANKVIGDYCRFIKALHGLSQSADWKVDGNDNYQDHILQCGKEEEKLRIADLREKVHHERMLKLLEDKLYEVLPNQCEHWSKEKEYIDDNKTYNTGKVFYNTSFSRGLGITEVFVIINESYRLMIQLQSNQYRKCLITHRIPGETEKELEDRQERISKGLLKLIWRGYGIPHSFGIHFKYDYKPGQIGQKRVCEILNEVVVDIKSIKENMDKLKELK